MIPSVGRIVHYQLGKYDLDQLNHRMSDISTHRVGQVVPMLILKVHASPDKTTEDSAVNGRVFLDGRHDLWVTSRAQGDHPGSWAEPARVEPEPEPEAPAEEKAAPVAEGEQGESA